MTIDEIDRLEAGREADTLVAELLVPPGVQFESMPWDPETREPYWNYTESGYREKFRPTSDPAAAAVVYEWLRANAPLALEDEDLADGTGLAICKAALRAILESTISPKKRERDCPDLALTMAQHA